LACPQYFRVHRLPNGQTNQKKTLKKDRLFFIFVKTFYICRESNNKTMTTTIELLSVNLQEVSELIEGEILKTEQEEDGEFYTEINCDGINFLLAGNFSCYWESDGDPIDPQNTNEPNSISVNISHLFSTDEMENEYEFSDTEISKIEKLLNSHFN
tara:strand:- start:291 stop:758 length:468 start_codon:yes stop_codon:yes gene_type:complete